MEISKRLIEKQWPLTDVSLGEDLEAFGDRTTRVITAKEGEFVVKITTEWRSVKTADEHAAIFDFLYRKGFRDSPRLLKTRTGQNVQWIDERPVILLERIQGNHPEPIPDNCRQVGEITALLHQIEGYPHDYLFTVADVTPEFFDKAKNLPFGDEYLEIVKTLPDFEVLPKSLIHGEIIGNTIQRQDGHIIGIDWDEAGVGTRILDVGHPLIVFFISEDLEFNQAGARAFYEGYFSKMQLTDEEENHIFDAGMFYALRYIIYGNTAKRWERIKWALKNRALLVSTFDGLNCRVSNGNSAHH